MEWYYIIINLVLICACLIEIFGTFKKLFIEKNVKYKKMSYLWFIFAVMFIIVYVSIVFSKDQGSFAFLLGAFCFFRAINSDKNNE